MGSSVRSRARTRPHYAPTDGDPPRYALTAVVLYLIFNHASTLLDRRAEIRTLVMMQMIAFLLLCIGIQFMLTGSAEFNVKP